jgi:RHS repeat-associated protein
MAGISSQALNFGGSENKELFVKQQFNDEFDVDFYQFKYRNEDPQIGRFLQVDPLSEKFTYNSVYSYAENRPISGIDLEGLEYLSSDALILIGSLQYNTSSNQVMYATVNLNTLNTSPATTNYFRQSPPESGYIGGGNTEIANISYQPQTVTTQDQATGNDILEQPQSSKPADASIPTIPKSKKEVEKMEQTKNYSTPAVDPEGAGKLDLLMGVVFVLTKAEELKIDNQISNDLKEAKAETPMALLVIQRIQKGLTLNVIPTDLKNGSDLQHLANYMLYGQQQLDNTTKQRFDIILKQIQNAIQNESK